VAQDSSVRAVVLTGSGRAFCVGQDLAEHVEALRANPARALKVVADSYNPMVLALSAVPVPVVVGINGACVGAGLGLALAGDIRVASAATDSLQETLAIEARLQASLGPTADHREAVEAFLAKRKPSFTGQ
jgi:enoyl-CoA hydratase/carnithine racemase